MSQGPNQGNGSNGNGSGAGNKSQQSQSRPKANTSALSPTSAGNMFQRIFSMMRAGLSFGGKRDLYTVYGYPRLLCAEDLVAKYERQDITSRIVDTPAEETWSYPPEVDTDDKAFSDAWDQLKLQDWAGGLWPALTQADKLCAFGQFAVMWIGLPGDPKSPPRKVNKIEDVLYFKAYGANSAAIDKWEIDTANRRFGLPLVYSLKTTDASLAQLVHYSRVIHIADRPLQGSVYGIPRLNHVYNLLDDLLKIGGGSAETYWLTANRGLQVDVDKEMDLDVDDATQLTDELEEFQHQLRRYIRTRGVKITPLGAEIADPTGVFAVLMSLLAAATGIPQRILMGAEAGQLASEQDRANWAEFMTRRRKTFAEPYILVPMVKQMQSLGLLPMTEKPIRFEWPSAFHQSPLERAQTQAQFARSVVNISRQAEKGFAVCTLEEARLSLDLPAEVPPGQTLPKPPPPKPVAGPFGNPSGGGDGAAS